MHGTTTFRKRLEAVSDRIIANSEYIKMKKTHHPSRLQVLYFLSPLLFCPDDLRNWCPSPTKFSGTFIFPYLQKRTGARNNLYSPKNLGNYVLPFCLFFLFSMFDIVFSKDFPTCLWPNKNAGLEIGSILLPKIK